MTLRRSRSDIAVKPFYGPEDSAALDYEKALGDPGSYPYTRGRRARLERGGAWIQRELSGEGPPARSNAQFRYLIEKGALGLDVIGDAPTVACLDPDHSVRPTLDRHARGVALPPAGLSSSSTTVSRSTASRSRTRYPGGSRSPDSISWRATRGVDAAEVLRGSVIQAPLYARTTATRSTCRSSCACASRSTRSSSASREMPQFHSFVEDTYYISDGGPDAVDEMALGFVEIRHVVRELARARPRHRPLRAAHRHPRQLPDGRLRGDRQDPRHAPTVRAHDARGVRRARPALLVGQHHRPHRGQLAHRRSSRSTTSCAAPSQALALALAGVQAIEISAFDEAYRTPSPESHLVGLRTQQIIELETGVTRVADPLGGSYYVESLTDEMERRICARIAEIETMGDPAELSARGWFRTMLENAMVQRVREIEDGTVPRVGVNVFRMSDDEDRLLRDVAETKIEPCWDHAERIREFKRTRNERPVVASLADLRAQAADDRASLMPPILAALDAGATLGEISGVLRLAYGQAYDPFGTDKPPAGRFGDAPGGMLA